MVRIQLPTINISTEIMEESQASVNRALTEVGDTIVPAALRSNFDSKGTRGGNPQWPAVSPNSVVAIKKIDPGYRRNPDLTEALVDTGSLRDSATTTRSGNSIETTLNDYGFPHDNGSAVRPDNVPVPQREHMYLVEGEDTDKIDAAFVEAFK